MAEIYRWNSSETDAFNIRLSDDIFCTLAEEYLETPLISGNYSYKSITFVEYRGDIIGIRINNPDGKRYGICLTSDTSISFEMRMLSEPNTSQNEEFTYTYYTGSEWLQSDTGALPLRNSPSTNVAESMAAFSTNVPVFESSSDLNDYLTASTDSDRMDALKKAINFIEYDVNTTERYHYYGVHGTGVLYNGSMEQTSDPTGYRSLVMLANSVPCFYFVEGTFELKLLSGGVLSSYYMAAPENIISKVPESSWQEGLMYSGPFYGTLAKYKKALNNEPENGTYSYSVSIDTNIPIFGNKEDAEEAIETGDFTGAINYPDIISGGNYQEPGGDPETETTFGEGSATNPFCAVYAMDRNTLINNVANVFFTDDSGLIDDIKKGLELWGANPIDSILSLRLYPFNLSQIATLSPTSHVYFGSYWHDLQGASINKVTNLSANYLNAGTLHLSPIQKSYKDFEPYTTLTAFFPYLGWQQLEIDKYYDKTVNVRYYVDIMTGQSVIVTVVDGIFTDYFGPCEIGMEMPVTGSNYAQYAQGQVRLIQQGINSYITGPTGGIPGAISGGMASMGSFFEMTQKGSPKDSQTTKGSFSTGIGNYMPGYVIFRFDIKEMLEPSSLLPIYGKPSYTSGYVREFSGFLKCEVAKMDTTGMNEEESNLVSSYLASGIYI